MDSLLTISLTNRSSGRSFLASLSFALAIELQMDPEEQFLKVLSVDPLYEPERFSVPFWDFKYKFQSLHRHWVLSCEFVAGHITALQGVQSDGSAEFDTAYSERAEVDIDTFPEYLRLSTVAYALSLLEDLLVNVSQELAEEAGIEVSLDNRPLPYINKYIFWFTRTCGLDITVDKSTWKRLDAIREMRNRFIHNISRDIPEEIRHVLNEMAQDVDQNSGVVSDEWVDSSLNTVAALVEHIELAYWQYHGYENG